MRFRDFGSTGLKVSEIGFGGWAIGGQSYGAVAPEDALNALAHAEDLGCNFVDTAAVYGNSEEIIGRFLRARRDRWYVASKYSGQPQGMSKLLDEQLRRLGTDHIDFYQLHWAPRGRERSLYEELESLKKVGKVRFTGVSLYRADEIDFVAAHTAVDGIQVAFSLLDPWPLLVCREAIRKRGIAVVVRSCLKDGFLTGKYSASSVFRDSQDQRHGWTAEEIAELAAAADSFQFLAAEAGSLLNGAVRYALAFPEVSSVIISTKNADQAFRNFSEVGAGVLSDASLARISAVQRSLGLMGDGLRSRLGRMIRGAMDRFHLRLQG